MYLRARYDDPATGQFLSGDALEGISGSAYGNVGGDPLNDTDPLGLMCLGAKCVSVCRGYLCRAANVGATCFSAMLHAGASGWDCAARVAIYAATLGLNRTVFPHTGWDQVTKHTIPTQADNILHGGISPLGDGFGWARGYKTQSPIECASTPPSSSRL